VKFLFTTLPSNDLGLLTRSLPIANEMVERDHEIVFCSPAKAPSKLIAEAGFDNLLPKHPMYHLLAEGLSPRGLLRAAERSKQDYGNLFSFLGKLISAIPTRFAPQSADVWNMDHAGAQAGMLNTGFVRANCESMRSLIAACEADVVVDFWNPFAVVAARAAQKPLVTVIQADAHPTGQGFIWWKQPPPSIPTPVPVMNKVLAEYGLEPIDKTEELCVGDLTLVLGTPETDPLPTDADVTYIGPILWQKQQAELPEWVDDLNLEQPVIWVYSGNPRYTAGTSAFDSIVVLHACITALANEDVQVVLTTGHHPLPEKILPLPTNFRHKPYVPGLAMAERSDLLIHHGGYGSCQTGLYTGTPAVIIPTFSERESNARRVAALGAGDFVAPTCDGRGRKHVQAEDVRAKVRRILSDPSFTANARRISEKLRAHGGASEAARLIEDFARAQLFRTTAKQQPVEQTESFRGIHHAKTD
jgi:UDP:flavonoid glycosyltransferase YjiC (YdhE family)